MRIGPQKGPQPHRGILPAPLTDTTRQANPSALSESSTILSKPSITSLVQIYFFFLGHT